MCLRRSGLRENSVLSVPVEGLGEACGWWGRRRRWPGLRDQKGLLDQSCVCVIHSPERSRFCFFPYPFSPGPPQELRATPFLCFKASLAFRHFSILWFGGFPEYLGGEKRARRMFHLVSEFRVKTMEVIFFFFFLLKSQ